MATKLFYLSNFPILQRGELQEDGTAPAAQNQTTEWVVGTAPANRFALMVQGQSVPQTEFGTTDIIALGNTLTGGDGYDTQRPYRGTFAEGVFTLNFTVVAENNASGQAGRVRARLWRSVDGLNFFGASDELVGSIVGPLNTLGVEAVSVISETIPTFDLDDEFLYLQIEWEITTAASNAAADITLRNGPTVTLVTSDFVPVAEKVFYLRLDVGSTENSNFPFLQEGGTSPTGLSNTGWTVGTTSIATPYQALSAGTKGTAGGFQANDQLGNNPLVAIIAQSFLGRANLEGYFEAGLWTFTFKARASANASGQEGRVNIRVWKMRATGINDTVELTSGKLTGSVASPIVIGADATSVVTWNAPEISLGESASGPDALVVECEWEITTAGGNASADVMLRVDPGTTLIPPTFHAFVPTVWGSTLPEYETPIAGLQFNAPAIEVANTLEAHESMLLGQAFAAEAAEVANTVEAQLSFLLGQQFSTEAAEWGATYWAPEELAFNGAEITYTATASGTILLAGAGVADHGVAATAVGSITLSAAASGTHGVAGSAAGTINLSGAGAADHGVAATAAGTVAATGSGAGEHGVAGSAVAALSFASASAGDLPADGSGTGVIATSGAGAGDHGVAGSAVGAIAIIGSGVGTFETAEDTFEGDATGVVSLSGAAAGDHGIAGAAAGLVSFSGGAEGSAIMPEAGPQVQSAIGIGSYLGRVTPRRQIEEPPIGVAAATISFGGRADGSHGLGFGFARGSLSFAGGARGFVLTPILSPATAQEVRGKASATLHLIRGGATGETSGKDWTAYDNNLVLLLEAA